MTVWKDIWFCRWCGNTYIPLERTPRDGFCTDAHKMAHHRAYNRYVTRKRGPRSDRKNRVTHKRTK